MLPDPVRVSEGDADESVTLMGLSEEERIARMEEMDKDELEQVCTACLHGRMLYYCRTCMPCAPRGKNAVRSRMSKDATCAS